jgi:hypothetical protein
MLPHFQIDGNLAPGIHPMEWQEFAQSFGSNPHRCRLLNGLHQVLLVLAAAGCETAYIDGSFVTLKQVPADFDGAWELRNVDVQRLSLIEPLLFEFSKQRAAQKRKYLGEMFPADSMEGGSGRTFLEFFQQDKQTGARKGVVAIDLRTLK